MDARRPAIPETVKRYLPGLDLLNIRKLLGVLLALAGTIVPLQTVSGQRNSCLNDEKQPGVWRIGIEANASTRCPAFELAAGQGIRVYTGSGSNLNLDIFVYDTATIELTGKSDDEAAETHYEWRAIQRGKYYVVLRNVSDQGGTAELRVLAAEGEKTLGSLASPNTAVINVYYATDRAVSGQSNKGVSYGTEPAADDSVALGIAKVSIPRAHQMGELEGPSILRLEYREDPEKHVVLVSTTPEESGPFYHHISDRILQSRRHEAFVFVHGFNVTFEEAVRRTAQIAYDLGFDGAPILYSWPSHGELGLVAYNQDGRNAELSVTHLRDFLNELASRTGVQTIHVIAHSMGNRVVVGALAGGSTAKGTVRVREVALMAPDIDAAEFRKLALAMRPSVNRVTLYASSGDEAIKLSMKLAGYPRAGEGGNHIVVMPGVLDTIDCSSVDTSILGLGHSYYADNSTILSDLFRLIRGDSIDDRFRLRAVQNAQGKYWAFAPSVK